MISFGSYNFQTHIVTRIRGVDVVLKRPCQFDPFRSRLKATLELYKMNIIQKYNHKKVTIIIIVLSLMALFSLGLYENWLNGSVSRFLNDFLTHLSVLSVLIILFFRSGCAANNLIFTRYILTSLLFVLICLYNGIAYYHMISGNHDAPLGVMVIIWTIITVPFLGVAMLISLMEHILKK